MLSGLMKSRSIAGISLVLAFAFVACGKSGRVVREWTPQDHPQPRATSAPAEDSVATAEQQSAEAIAGLFTAQCAGCHGQDGRGNGPGKPPGAVLPDMTLATWQAARSNEELAATIFRGKAMMPAFGSQLEPRTIAELVQRIRLFGTPNVQK